ncbi:CoA-binding protein [Thalassotalea sp. HSM 43]|uniref:CoA-binding protein n=1 Tax=Thalassotalea sp. HSM 43 TaxID=2552945 RepID=UPI0010819848|nr:CoA-binding protein [Thalassotalea sp. HSM 43]QBY03716.1 CoA-binding protein [Thalassotalea sp. HSM 43]
MQDIIDTLKQVKTIALLGASDKPQRASHRVMAYLQQQGYRVLPVNPQLAGQTLHNEMVFASLADVVANISEPIDMVDVFRLPKYLAEIVEQCHTLAIGIIWTQLGVVDADAQALAQQYGIDMIVDRCPKIDIPTLQSQGLLSEPVHG